MIEKVNQATQNELRRILRQFKSSLIYAVVFSFFINILGLSSLLYMIQLFDRVLTSRSEETLLMLTLVITVLIITQGLLEFIRTRLLNRLANRLDIAIHERLFDIILKKAFDTPGGVGLRPMDDLNRLTGFLNSSTITMLFDVLWIPIYIFICYLFHPWIAYFIIIVALISTILAYLQHIETKNIVVEAGAKRMQASNFLRENLQNVEIISALGMQQQIKKLWKKLHFSSLTAQTRADDLNTFYSRIAKTVSYYAGILIFGLSCYLAITGAITIGMIIGSRILASKALQPIDMLISSWMQIALVRFSLKQLNELLEHFPQQKSPMPLMPPQGNIIVDKIFYTPHNSTEAILKDISFILFKGEILAVIGQSAAGKSTLAKVLMGIWPATYGSVRLDGADIALWDRNDLGQYIGYLPQDVELFNASVAENICRFGERDAQAIIEAAKLAGVHELILRLPRGYDTPIGSNAQAFPLSGGQKQRIALARALYHNPVFIVLDEPNSNLDEQGEYALLDTIKQLKQRGTTVVVITHRPSLLAAVDKILLLNSGMLQLFGPRDKVMDIINNPDNSEFIDDDDQDDDDQDAEPGQTSADEKKALP